MTTWKKTTLIFFFIFFSAAVSAQVEVAHLFSKGFSATGFGGFLHIGAAISEGDELSGELGLYYFSTKGSHLAFAPVLAGYRHTFNGSGSGFYIEPAAGYTFGSTDIQKTDAGGNPLYDAAGHEVDQKISGFTAALGLGYIIPSASVPFNIGLRYEHLFVSGDPSQNMLSLRVSYSLAIGRKYTARRP